MARLYVISGYVTTGVINTEDNPSVAAKYYFNKEERISPGGQAMLGLLFGGPLAAAYLYSQASDEVEAPERRKRLATKSLHFLNGKDIGLLGKEQYMAMDLPAGTYSVKFKNVTRDSATVPIELRAGQTLLLLANYNHYMGPYFEVCGDECAQLVGSDQRVFATAPGYPPAIDQ